MAAAWGEAVGVLMHARVVPVATRPRTASERLQIALQLNELAEQMQEQNLRRAHPDASDAEIAAMLIEWLHTRPGAEHGDACGRSVPWPRPKP